jgi:hypothetical protein
LNLAALFRFEVKTRAGEIMNRREVKSRWIMIAVQERHSQVGDS